MSDSDPWSDQRLAVIAHQNRLMLAQLEALRIALAERDDEITQLSARLLAQETHPPMRLRSLWARLGFRQR
ncbi:hypothetical protein [uncultured Roseovarius sp.]|uniref:hypothetical protein n=1 Tax=uncultured Roseovarius sp. TaxID=293344 RepID=UPI00262D497E|nr:hypothetical protein [uncultured Roseovarius sp.]